MLSQSVALCLSCSEAGKRPLPNWLPGNILVELHQHVCAWHWGRSIRLVRHQWERHLSEACLCLELTSINSRGASWVAVGPAVRTADAAACGGLSRNRGSNARAPPLPAGLQVKCVIDAYMYASIKEHCRGMYRFCYTRKQLNVSVQSR